jgi:hypothetical protein
MNYVNARRARFIMAEVARQRTKAEENYSFLPARSLALHGTGKLPSIYETSHGNVDSGALADRQRTGASYAIRACLSLKFRHCSSIVLSVSLPLSLAHSIAVRRKQM